MGTNYIKEVLKTALFLLATMCLAVPSASAVETIYNQEGNLHYGTYRVLNTETQAEIFRMEVSENGSVQYSWNGQYISYDAPKNVYSHRTESQ